MLLTSLMLDLLLSSHLAIAILFQCKLCHINFGAPNSPITIHGEENPEFFIVTEKALHDLPLPVIAQCIFYSPLCRSLCSNHTILLELLLEPLNNAIVLLPDTPVSHFLDTFKALLKCYCPSEAFPGCPIENCNMTVPVTLFPSSPGFPRHHLHT